MYHGFLRIGRIWPKKYSEPKMFLMEIDSFSGFWWTNSWKNELAQTLKGSLEDVIKSAKRDPNLIETDDEKDIV